MKQKIQFRRELPTDTHAKKSDINDALEQITAAGGDVWGRLPTSYKTRKSAHSTATWLRRTRKGWRFKVVGLEIWARKSRARAKRG